MSSPKDCRFQTKLLPFQFCGGKKFMFTGARFPGLHGIVFPATFAASMMQSLATSPRRGDGHLWMIALGLSLLVNLLLVALVGFAVLKSATFQKENLSAAPAPPPERVATIYAVPAESPAAPESVPEPEKRFARTSDDQIAPAPEKTAYIGERNTRATSDRPPDATAPPLPSQAGIEPRDEQDIETTESDYRDGSLAENPAAPPFPEMLSTPPEPEAPSPIEETTTAGSATDMPGPDSESAPPPPPRETLLDGPNPVDVQVPRETSDDESPKPTSQAPKTASLPPKPETPETPKPTETAPPKPSRDPAFSGFQRKTAVTGSISRSGRSALDVEDSALGRYQAAISRAVEQEWQRNCVRHRDFITPGFLTVRFFVEPGGKVRSVQFVGEMETGEIQKGFTLNSIRDAEIPAMPKTLRSEYDEEPLELLFRFYF
jgi:hypothetical protein